MVEHCPTVRLKANALDQLARQKTVFDLVHTSKRRFVTHSERITLMRQAVREGGRDYANEISSLSPRGAIDDRP